MQLVAEGVPSVVIHGAKTICRDRGFNDRESDQRQLNPLAEEVRKVKASIENRARQKGITYDDELESVLRNHSHLFKREIIDWLAKEQTGRGCCNQIIADQAKED